MKQKERKFIKVNRSLGRFRVGIFSIIQFAFIALCLALAVIVDELTNIGLIPATFLTLACLMPFLVVVGNRPDRFIKRLFSKPQKWRRGMMPCQPLLKGKR